MPVDHHHQGDVPDDHNDRCRHDDGGADDDRLPGLHPEHPNRWWHHHHRPRHDDDAARLPGLRPQHAGRPHHDVLEFVDHLHDVWAIDAVGIDDHGGGPASTAGPAATHDHTRRAWSAGDAVNAEPTEAAMTSAILEASRFLGWRTAHFRPALTRHGWRTAVQGDGAGFPDLVLIHPAAGLVWWVELKTKTGRLSVDQEAWGEALIRAGAGFRVVKGRAGLSEFLDDMAIAARSPRHTGCQAAAVASPVAAAATKVVPAPAPPAGSVGAGT